jgi:hypothetical protein
LDKRNREAIMSKTNDTSRENLDHGVLADSELNAVTGGLEPLTIQKLVDVSTPGGGDVGGGGPTAFSAWNQLLKDYGYIR